MDIERQNLIRRAFPQGIGDRIIAFYRPDRYEQGAQRLKIRKEYDGWNCYRWGANHRFGAYNPRSFLEQRAHWNNFDFCNRGNKDSDPYHFRRIGIHQMIYEVRFWEHGKGWGEGDYLHYSYDGFINQYFREIALRETYLRDLWVREGGVIARERKRHKGEVPAEREVWYVGQMQRRRPNRHESDETVLVLRDLPFRMADEEFEFDVLQ